LSLSLDERQCPQIFSIQIEQVKSDEYTGGLSEEQIFENWPALAVNAR